MSWVHTGATGAAVSNDINARNEQRRAEARARGYFPNRYRLKAQAGPSGSDHIGRIIILDQQAGPRYHEHALVNPRTGFHDVYEPCPKEFENCPLCPPSGERESYFVMLLTVLNLEGYTNKQGIRVAPTKELLAVKVSQHAMFDRLAQNYNGLRGLELKMVRQGQRSSVIGEIDPATPVVKHTDAEIVEFLQSMGKWVPKTDREGKVLEPENWMSVPFEYSKFLHKPDANRLRTLYGGTAPLGSNDYNQTGGGYGAAPATPPAGYTTAPAAPPMTQQPPQAGGYNTPPADTNQTQPPTPTQGTAGNDGSDTMPVRQRSAPPATDGAADNQSWAQSQSGPAPAVDLDDEIPF
jgi:hypothetical protein